MSIQGTWADAGLIIQTVADVLKVTIQIVESNQGFAPFTASPLFTQFRKEILRLQLRHIDECHYVLPYNQMPPFLCAMN